MVMTKLLHDQSIVSVDPGLTYTNKELHNHHYLVSQQMYVSDFVQPLSSEELKHTRPLDRQRNNNFDWIYRE